MRNLPSGNLLLSFALTLVGFSGLCLAQQAPPPNANQIPDYDVRAFTPQDERQPASSPEAQARLTVQRRQAGVAAFLAAQPPAERGARVSFTRFGLPKVYLREGRALTAPSTLAPEQIALRFLDGNTALFPFSPQERADLRLSIRDDARDAAYLVFEQNVGGIPVYEGQVKFVLSKAGEIIQVASGGVAPGVTVAAAPVLNPEQAVRAAYASLGPMQQPVLGQAAVADGKTAFPNPGGRQLNPITASQVAFPLNATTARLAYRIHLELDALRSYEILIDGEDGSLLYRRNLVLYEAQGRVWPESPMNGQRQMVSFPPATSSGPAPDAWLAADAVVTTGNNVDAYLDADGNEIPDPGPISGLQNGRAYSPERLFDFPYGDGLSGLDPRQFQAAAVTNLFYLINTAHDYFYRLGFTESAANFQKDNYGRGGKGNDAVNASAQYLGAQNNAAFSPTSEGYAPRIIAGIFTRGTSTSTDDLDADYDGGVILHEYAHGVSTRLVSGGSNMACLSKPMAGAMGEGWSDYFAASFYNNPVMGPYLTQNTKGVRRYSYEGYPYTYEDFGNQGYEVHKDGEIWAATLWDLRKALGQSVTDRLVTDGLKATPCSPTMPDARDAILAADMASNGGANRAAIWTVFARHGLGYSAAGVDGDGSTGIRYDAAYDRPPDLQGAASPAVASDPLSVAVAMGDNYAYVVQATNPNGGILKYELLEGPVGMTIDSATGKITWRATFTGKRVKVAVTDGKGSRVVHGYFLPVVTELQAGSPIVISGESGSTGYAYITIPPNVPVIQATVRNSSLPFFVSLLGRNYGYYASGYFSTPSVTSPANGRWSVTVGSRQEYSNAVLTVSLISPQPLLLSDPPLTGLSGERGSDRYYSVTVPAGLAVFSASTSGGTGDVNTDATMFHPAPSFPGPIFAWAVGNNESLIINNPAPGDWFFHLHGYVAYENVTLTLSSGPLAINPQPPLGVGKVGVPYAQTFTAAGGTPPYDWSVSAGDLPPGLTLSAGGVLSGIPVAGGSYKWTIRVADRAATPAISGLEFSLLIEGIEITSSASLPDGFVGGAYYQTLAIKGAVAPCQWMLASGALPPGISLRFSGVLAGAPTQAGSFTFTAQVRDANGATATGAFRLKVIPGSIGAMPRRGVFPQIAAGEGWNTEIWLSNIGGPLVPIPVRIAFYGGRGLPGLQSAKDASPTTTFQVEQQGSVSTVSANFIDAVIPPRGTLVIKTRDVPVGVQGWAEVLSSENVDGFAVFRSSNLGQGVTPLIKDLASSLLDVLYDNTAGQSTMGIALVNIGHSCPVYARAWDDLGNDVFYSPIYFTDEAVWPPLWPASGHKSFMLADYFESTAGKRGSIRFATDQGCALAGVALKVDLANSTFVSVPVRPN